MKQKLALQQLFGHFCLDQKNIFTFNGDKLEVSAWTFSCQVKINFVIFVLAFNCHAKHNANFISRPGLLGGVRGVRPGDRLLRYKVKHFFTDDYGSDDCDNSDFPECRVNLLTPSLMLGDYFATLMEGRDEHSCANLD